MQTEEFLKKVRIRAGLKDNEEARRATDAVFGALKARISHGGGHNVADQFPKELKKLWESGIVEHIVDSLAGVEHMNLNRFLARVQDAAHLANTDEAEGVTRAVFMTMYEQISPGAVSAISHQLPEDIRALWQTSRPAEEMVGEEGKYGSEAIGPAAASVFRSDEQLERDIEELLEVSDEVDAEKIDVHVQQGAVTLRGVVRTSAEWEAAGRVAFKALGTKEVHNELTVIEAM